MMNRQEALEESDPGPTVSKSALVQHIDDEYAGQEPIEFSARDSDHHDAEDDNRDRAPEGGTKLELDKPVKTHWYIARPAPTEVKMGVQIGSLIMAPIPQFGKDPRGKEKTKDGFFASPHGMMLVKKYPLTVYNVDRNDGRMPTKLYCMQRHTYGESGLWKGNRLRDDYHLHVKLIPPDGNKEDKGDAEHDPLLVRALYNGKSISENAYLEFKSIFVIELDEYVELDGQLETSSWLRLFEMHLSTHMSTVLLQLESSPGLRKEAEEIVNNLAKTFVEKAGAKFKMIPADRGQTATINEATARNQVIYGELHGQANSASTIAQNQLVSTRDGNASQQATKVRRSREGLEGYTWRQRSRSPRAAESQRYRERDDDSEGDTQARDRSHQARTYEDERTRRQQGGNWPNSRNGEERHTLRESRYGQRDHRSDRVTNPSPHNGYQTDSEYSRSDYRYDTWNDRGQDRRGGASAHGHNTPTGGGRGGRGGRGRGRRGA